MRSFDQWEALGAEAWRKGKPSVAPDGLDPIEKAFWCKGWLDEMTATNKGHLAYLYGLEKPHKSLQKDSQ